MKYDGIVEGVFLDRPNRFIAHCLIDDVEVECHVPNTGPLTGLLEEGRSVLLEPAKNPNRKTKFSLVSVEKKGAWINVDSQAPNKIVFEAVFENPALISIPQDELDSFHLKQEVTYGNSRFDLFYETDKRKGFIEIKGVTLEENNKAMFPDAETKRGQKHLTELMAAKEDGYETGAFFCVQVPYAENFSINRSIDPKLGEIYDEAKAKGVEIYSYKCDVTKDEVVLSEEIPHE